MAKKIINVVYKVDSKELDAVKTSIKGAENATKKFDDELKKAGQDVKKVAKESSQSFLDFKSVIGTITFAGIIASLGALSKKIFDLGVQQEQLNIAFTTFLGSADKAKRLMAELTKFSIVTPFTPDQVNKAAKALLAFGVQAEQIIPTLKMLGDVSSGTGKDLTEMAIIFGQIRSTGRLMGQDLLQLINAGFNPLQVISEKTGRSVRDLKEDMEKGLISFEMVEGAFKSATSEGGLFFNLMEKQSETVGGKLSTIAGNLEEVMKVIFASNIGIIKSFVEALEDASDGLLFFFETAEQKQDKYEQSVIERFKASGFSIEKEIEIQEGRINQRISEIKDYLAQIKQVGESAGVTPDMISIREQEILVITRELDVIKKLRKEKEEEKKVPGYKPKGVKLSDEAPLFFQDNTPAPDYDVKEDDLEAHVKEMNKIIKDQYDYEQTKITETANLRLEKETEAAEKIKAIREAAFDFGVEALGRILVAEISNHDEEQQMLNDKYNREIELAGNNEKAKKTIQERQRKEQEALNKKQAQDDKDRRIKTILAESLINAVKALGLPPIPGANFLAAAQALAFGALNAGLVGKYAEGGWIEGRGTPKSDSVPIMASRDEFMVNAASAAMSPNLLEAINSGEINDNILRAVAKTGGSQVNIMDDSGIIRAIQESRVDYISQGYTLMKVEKQGSNFKRYIRSKVQGY